MGNTPLDTFWILSSTRGAELEQPKPGRDLTTGSILGNVLYMGIPSMFGFAAMVIYQLTDLYWVAKGSVAAIARRYGERDIEGTCNAVEQTLALKFLIGLPMGVVGFFTISRILGFMTDDTSVAELGTAYGVIYMAGLPFMFTSYTVYTALRGIGDSLKAMQIMFLSTGLNMALDPLFIIKFDLGVEGAAMATVISAVCAVGVGMWVLRFGKTHIRVRIRGFRFDRGVMAQIARIGFPPFLESIARSVAFWLIAIFVAFYGTIIVASYGICMRIIEFGIVFAVGMELGASAIVGQSIGAGKPDRAEATARNAALVALGIAVGLSVFEIIFAEPIMGVFGKSREVQVKGAEVLIFFALSQPFVATAIALSSAFYGSGNTWPPTIAGLLTTWVFQIPLSALFVYKLGLPPTALWIVMILQHAVYLVMLTIWYRLGRWKTRQV
jgi:putative MATE family efflux protein